MRSCKMESHGNMQRRTNWRSAALMRARAADREPRGFGGLGADAENLVAAVRRERRQRREGPRHLRAVAVCKLQQGWSTSLPLRAQLKK